MDELRAQYNAELSAAHRIVKEEPQPDPATIGDHVFSEKNLVDDGGAGFGGDGHSPKGGA
jgi:hypothetical protein